MNESNLLRAMPMNPSAKINYYLSLTFSDLSKPRIIHGRPDNKRHHHEEKIVNIVPGYIYSFKFLNIAYQQIISANNVRVTNILNIAHDANDAIIECELTKDSHINGAKYYNKFNIPLVNLKQITYDGFTNFKYHYDNQRVWRNIIMILGITVSEIRAIILKLKFFDDTASESFKDITLDTDNRYLFTFFNYKEGILKQLSGTLKGIVRTEPIKPHKDTFVRESEEVVGKAESIYETSNTMEFYNADELCHDYKLIIMPDVCENQDTAECIYISSLRDCELITEEQHPTGVADDTESGDELPEFLQNITTEGE